MRPDTEIKTPARNGVGGSLAKLIGSAVTASVLSVTVLTTGVTHAGSIAEGGDYRMGSGMSCRTGYINASLPVVAAETAGIAWQITEVLRYDGTTFVSDQWSDYRWTSIGGGSTNQGDWVGYRSGFPELLDSFSVAPGNYYALRQWAYVDGGWIFVSPRTVDTLGNVYQVCFA